MCRSKLTAWVLLTGWLTLGLALPGAAWAQGKPFDEIQALIAILSEKIEAVQESIDTLSTDGGNNPTLRWDQVLPAADRFEVLAAFNHEAVFDKETGLVWEQSPLTTTHEWLGVGVR